MYKFEIEKSFDEESGKLKATIKVIESDDNCTKKVLNDSGRFRYMIVITRDNWNNLDKSIDQYIEGAKKKIDNIRENYKMIQKLGKIKQRITY